MTRLLSIFDSTYSGILKADRPIWEGQILAISSVAGVLALQFGLTPLFDQSVYLLAFAALLLCARMGAAGSVLTATVLLAAAGWMADAKLDLGVVQRGMRAVLFLLAGLGLAYIARRFRNTAQAAGAAPPARDAQALEAAEARSEALGAQLAQTWSQNSMGEMASVLAHELNQPLAAVTNYLRAARTLIANLELEDDDLIDAVSRAGDQAVRAGEIVRTMRDLATRGGTHLQPESLSGAIREIEFILGLISRDADVRVTYDLYQGHDLVLADRTQIQQLVVNLTRNAIEAVNKYPDRRVKISTKLTSDGQLLTTVEDSGPGLDPDITDRLFQPLASTKPEGMGLGLSISSAIVHNHRGRIWAEPSRLGGAAFCFVLARAGQDAEDVRVRSHSVRRR
jgi:signal transduction histidine kinase